MMKNHKITLFDFFLTLIFFIIILCIVVITINNTLSDSQKILFVETEEDVYYYSLDQKKTINIQGESGNTVIQIDNGHFSFIDSPCTHKYCVRMGKVSLVNYPVICLPNHVSAYIIDNKQNENQYDGISQ